MFASGFDAGFAIGLPPDEFELPHPALHPRLLLLLHRVLATALDVLRSSHGRLASFGEDSITTQLYHVLENDLRHRKSRGKTDFIPGFDEGIFGTVTRHTGATDYRGIKLKKEPDLFFPLKPAYGMRVLPTEYAVFTECKPVDAAHPSSSRYCDDGLNRFVEGEYAWAMQDALMVGYARQRSISCHLSPAMRQPSRRRALKTTHLPVSLKGEPFPRSEALHVSVHRRDFPWAWNKGAACPIRIYHSWHDCS